jgi:hypothetical protein
MGHRYYDPKVGRFVNRDPISYGGGLNVYAYAGNNPITMNDPEGTDKLDDLMEESLSEGGRDTTLDGMMGAIHKGSGAALQVSGAVADSIPGISETEALTGVDSLGHPLSLGMRTLFAVGIFGSVIPSGARWLKFLEENEGVLGAHVLERHVGLSSFNLWWRLVTNPGLTKVSTFFSKSEAATIVGETIEANTKEIQAWLNSPVTTPLNLDYSGNGVAIGQQMIRGRSGLVDCYNARVALKKGTGAVPWVVITAFPQ